MKIAWKIYILTESGSVKADMIRTMGYALLKLNAQSKISGRS